jgi:hypothetical protein
MAPPWLLAALAMFAVDEEGEPDEHLLLGQLRIAADELPDTPDELLVIGHDDDRTDRGPRGSDSLGAHAWRAARSDMSSVHRIYDFAAVCPPWSAPCFRICCDCYRSCYR